MEARQELALTPQQSFCQFFQDTLVKTIKLLESLVRYMCVSHPRDLYLKKWLWLQDIFQIAIPIQVMIVFVL